MKTKKQYSKKAILIFVFSILTVILPFNQAFSQNGKDDCTIEKHIKNGYYAAIWSVIDNGDNTYTIQIKVRNDGSGGDQELSHSSFEATPGTYSDVDVVDKSSNFNYGSIDLGPNLGGDPFQGFKVDNTGGIGNGVDGWFIVEYTLDSPFQDQYVLVKHGGNRDKVKYYASEFQQVLTCMTSTNNPPVAVDDNYTTPINTTVSGNIMANDSDPDEDIIAITILPLPIPSHGVITLLANGTFTYTPT